MITIRIDPHQSSLTAVAVDATAEPVATIRVAVSATHWLLEKMFISTGRR